MNKRKRLINYHDQIVELAKTNTARDICKILDLARNSVQGYLKRNNIECIVDRKAMSDYHDRIKVLANAGLNPTEIASQLNLDTNSVRHNLKTNNIPFSNGRSTVQGDEVKINKIIELIKNGLTYNEVIKELKVSSASIVKVLDNNDIKRLTSEESFRNRRPLNENAFKDFSDELAVYWYGWLLTDGCLSDNNSVSIGLQGRDVGTVQKFADYVGVNTEIKVKCYFHKQAQKNVYSASFAIKNKEIADRLRSQGMESRKSCKEKLPTFDWLHGENAGVFWRACIEGDGHVAKSIQHSSISLVGSEELINGFKTYAEVVCGAKTGKQIVSRNYGDPNFRQITYAGVDSRNIMRSLWSKGSVFLERKREVVLAHLEKYKERDEKINNI